MSTIPKPLLDGSGIVRGSWRALVIALLIAALPGSTSGAAPAASALPSGPPVVDAVPSSEAVGWPIQVAPLPRFRDTMTPAWALLDDLRGPIRDPQGVRLERIARDGRTVADALEAGLRSVLPDICYLDAWRLQWPLATDLRLVADLSSAGALLYAEAAAKRLAPDLAVADEAMATIGCD